MNYNKLLIEKTISEYISEVDSKTPTPGGGSVVALVGSLASALAGMVAHFTINKKSFKELSEYDKDYFNEAIKNIKDIKQRLISIIDEDANIFQEYMNITKKNNKEEEQKIVNKLINISLNTLKYCYELTYEFDKVLKYGNENLIADILIAYILINATSKASIININVNLSILNDNDILHNLRRDSLLYIDRINFSYKNLEERVNLFHIQ